MATTNSEKYRRSERAAKRSQRYRGHPVDAPSYPEHIDQDLCDLDQDMHLRWEPRSKMYYKGGGTAPEVEGRYELWTKDSQGAWYMIMTVRTADDGFILPGEWLIERIRHIHPQRFDGSLEKALDELVDKPQRDFEKRQILESDNAIADGIAAAADYHTPKVGAHIRNRGDRLFSGGYGGFEGLMRDTPPPPGSLLVPKRPGIITR